MPEFQSVTATKGLTVCLFAPPGAGKTRFVGTGPKTLIVRPPTDHTESIDTPHEVTEIVAEGAEDLLRVFTKLQQGEHRNFEWVWLDSYSLMDDFAVDEAFQQAVDRKPERAKFGPDQGEYGLARRRVAKWIRDMYGLVDMGHINFGITAHPMEWWDPIREEDVWAPNIPGKNMMTKITGYMHVVGYLQKVERKDKPTRTKLMTAAPGFYGKDLITNDQLDGMWDPTMPKLISTIRKSRRGTSSRPKTKTRKRVARPKKSR